MKQTNKTRPRQRSLYAALGAAVGVAAAAAVPTAAYAAPHSSGNAKQTVTVWSWFVTSTMEKAIAGYEKLHPNVTVNYTYYNYSPQYLTALKTAAASNTLPDIIGLQPGSLTQQYRPYLEPLNALAAKTWGAHWTKLVYPVDLDQMTMGNPPGNHNYYDLPMESQVLAVWYNVKLFRQLHLSVPTTLSQLETDAHALRKAGYLPMYQGGAGLWQDENVFMTLADQNSADVFEKAQLGQVPWTAPAMVNAMSTWRSLFTSGVFQDGALGDQGYPTGAQLFAAGRVGMVYFGSWWLQEGQLQPPLPPLVKDLNGFNFFLWPADAGNKPGPVVGGIDVSYGLTKTGASNPAAWPFLSSLVHGAAFNAAWRDLNDLPAFTGTPLPPVGPHEVALYKKFMALLPDAQNQRFYSPAVQNALDNALTGVAAGTLSPSKALAQVEAVQKKVLR
jgi:raffinose/stachyose/melibiose transport system substrate-binding protein